MKSLIVLDSPNESFTRVIEKAARTAKLEDWELTSIAEEDIGGAYGHEQRFKQKFYETIEEPIYTPTGKLSKKTRKIVRPNDALSSAIGTLERRIEERQPNLIIASGNESLEALVGQTGVGNYRGSILPARRGAFKVLAVEHPSYILRGGAKDFWVLTHDLKKAAREQEFPEIRREPIEKILMPSLGQIQMATGFIASSGSPWTIDFETRSGTVACFALGYRAQNKINTICIPIQSPSAPYWSPSDELSVWQMLCGACRNNPKLVNQNLPYDIYYMLRYGCEPSGIHIDTMLLHSILYPEFPKGLDFLCSFYLDDCVFYKGEGRNWSAGDRDPQLHAYCCEDAGQTLRVAEKQEEEAKRRGMWEMYHGENIK